MVFGRDPLLPHHNVALINLPDCPDDTDPRDSLARIHVIANRLPHLARSAQKAQHSAYERWVMNRLYGKTEHTYLDALPLHIACQFCEALGLALIGLATPLFKASEADLHLAGQAGFAVLQGGEAALNQALTSMIKNYGQGYSRHKQDLYALVYWLRANPMKPALEPIRATIRYHIFAHYPIAKGVKILGAKCTQAQVYTISGAVRTFGISRQRLCRGLVELGLGKYRETALQVILDAPLREVHIQKILDTPDNSIPWREAIDYLGVSEDVFRKLQRNHIIAPEPTIINRKVYYRKIELDWILDAFRKKSGPAQCELTNLTIIGEASHETSLSHLTILNLIRQGRAQNWFIPKDGRLSDLGIDTDELRRLMVKRDPSVLTLSECSALLRIKTKFIRLLVERGYLNARDHLMPKRGRARTGVCHRSIDRFLQHHTTFGRFCHAVQQPRSRVYHALKRAGVEPVIKPATDGWALDRDELMAKISIFDIDIPQSLDLTTV